MTDLVAIEPEPLAEQAMPILREVMTLAEAGDVAGLAIAVVHRDGCVEGFYTLTDVAKLLGAVSRLSFQINESVVK